MLNSSSIACLSESLQDEGLFSSANILQIADVFAIPYQIQHCFECIFKLFLKTVFNLFCEIGFK